MKFEHNEDSQFYEEGCIGSYIKFTIYGYMTILKIVGLEKDLSYPYKVKILYTEHPNWEQYVYGNRRRFYGFSFHNIDDAKSVHWNDIRKYAILGEL